MVHMAQKIDKLFSSIFTADLEEGIRITSNVFFGKKDDIKSFFQFFLPSERSPKIRGTIRKGSLCVFRISALGGSSFYAISVESTARHSQHTDDEGSRRKNRDFTTIVPAIKRNQREKGKENTTMKFIRRLLMAYDVSFRLNQSELFS